MMILRALVCLLIVLCVASPAAATYTTPLASGCTGSSDGNSATQTLDTTGADFLVVAVSDYIVGTKSTFADSQGGNSNTYTERTNYLSATWVRIRIFYTQAPAFVGGSHTFTATKVIGQTYPAVCVMAWAGSASTPFDVEAGSANGPADTTIQAGSVTPSVDNEVIIAVLGFGIQSSTASIDLSFTGLIQVNFQGSAHFGCAMAYLVETSAAAKNPTWTDTTGQDNAATNATFKAAAAAGGPPHGLLTHGVG